MFVGCNKDWERFGIIMDLINLLRIIMNVCIVNPPYTRKSNPIQKTKVTKKTAKIYSNICYLLIKY